MTTRRGTRLAVGLAVVVTVAGCASASGSAVTSSASPGIGPTSTGSGVASAVPVPDTSAAASAASASASAASAAASAATAVGWQSAPVQESVGRVQFRDVAWTGSRFVATASVLAAGGAFLDSVDGSTWNLQSGTRAVDRPTWIAAGPRGVLAIGLIDEVPAAWVSPGGLTWTARPQAFDVASAADHEVTVSDVVATDSGWLAVGREDPACQVDCGLDPIRAVVWRSTDGLHWTRGHDQPSLSGGAMISVARSGSGFVAVGLAARHAAAWTSADGRTWTRVADGPVFDRHPSADPSLWTTMSSVASGPGVIVAVGWEGPGGAHGPAARAWWSVDGRMWTDAPGEGFEAHGETSTRLAAVTATRAGFVAAGPSDGACRGGIWGSSDGRAWQCATADEPITELVPYATAASDTLTIVVGLANVTDPPLDGLPGAAWLRRLP